MGRFIDNDIREDAENFQGIGNLIQSNSRSHLFAAHITTSNKLEIHWSYNGGIDWVLDETFEESAAIEMPFLCRDWNSGNNDIYLSYSYGAVSPYGAKVYRRDYLTGIWTVILALPAVYSEDGKVKLLLCFNELTSGRLHLIWVHKDSILQEMFIKHKYTDNKGMNWTDCSDIDLWWLGAGEKCYGMDIDRNGTNIFFNVYLFHPSFYYFFTAATFKITNIGYWTPYELVFKTKFNDSTSWQYDVRYGASMLITRGGTLWHASFSYSHNNSNYQFRVSYSPVSSESWTASISEIPAGFIIRKGTLQLASDGNNNIYLFYAKTDDKLYYRKCVGTSWGEEKKLSTHFRMSIEKHNKWTADKLAYVYFDTV